MVVEASDVRSFNLSTAFFNSEALGYLGQRPEKEWGAGCAFFGGLWICRCLWDQRNLCSVVAGRLRDMKTELLGQLASVSGVVVRTSEVRPELLYGTFRCLECGHVQRNVEQQFKYTQVPPWAPGQNLTPELG